jgi:hypothetical protein
LLSSDIAESVEVLEVLKKGLTGISGDIALLIKRHPDVSAKLLIKGFGQKNWPARFSFFEGSIQEALGKASVIISSNSSSMVEAAAKGIPVIFLGRQAALNQNPLKSPDFGIVTECFSAQEMADAITKQLKTSDEENKRHKEIGRKMRDLFFTPVNEETLSAYYSAGKDA